MNDTSERKKVRCMLEEVGANVGQVIGKQRPSFWPSSGWRLIMAKARRRPNVWSWVRAAAAVQGSQLQMTCRCSTE